MVIKINTHQSIPDLNNPLDMDKKKLFVFLLLFRTPIKTQLLPKLHLITFQDSQIMGLKNHRNQQLQ